MNAFHPSVMTAALACTLVLSACDNSPEARQAKQDAEVAKLVSEVSAVAGASEDDSGACGKLAPLLGALPKAETMDGLGLSYRGCESPMTANLTYESEAEGIYYTVSVLRAEMADLPGENQHWQGLLDMNRQAIESLIATQRAMMDVGSKSVASGAADPLSAEERARLPRSVKLPNGADAVLYNEGDDWSLVSVMKDRYVLRIDLLNALGKAPDSAAAEKMLLAKAAEINYASL